MDDTLDKLLSKHNKLNISKILEQLYLIDSNATYILVYPENNRDKVVLKPTRFYLSKPAIRALQVDVSRFISNELQIEMFHCIQTMEDKHDPVFRPLDRRHLSFEVADNFCITPVSKLNSENYFKHLWGNSHPRIFTTSRCKISPKNVYVEATCSELILSQINNQASSQKSYPPDLEAIQILFQHITDQKISLKDVKNNELTKMLCKLCPHYEDDLSAQIRIVQVVGSGVNRRGRTKKKIYKI